MLEDAVLFKDGEGAAREADFLIHAVLFNMDDREAAFARDTRNGGGGRRADIIDNQRAGMRRLVRITGC